MGAPFVQRWWLWTAGTLVALAVPISGLSAQAVGTISGTVTAEDTGQPIGSAQVHIPGLQIGTLTSPEGRFTLENVPVGQHEVRAELIGRQAATEVVEVGAGASLTVDLALRSRALALDAVVVTGVAGATPESQLAFTVEQLQVNPAQVASAINVGSMLQGRMSGTRVIQGSGMPGDEPSIQLRGPTTIMQSQEPLLIVDGVISRGTLADIDPNDIENIEVVKGAAAASLYGSRAQAGVIDVVTRRGTGLQEGTTEFTFRNSMLVNQIDYLMGMSLSHQYQMNDAQTTLIGRDGRELDLRNRRQEIGTGDYLLADGGDGTNPFTTFKDQPIPADLFGGSPFEALMEAGNSHSTYISASGNEGNTQYRASARYQRDQGVLRFHDGVRQQNFRLNLDQRVSDQIQVSLSSYLAQRNQHVVRSGSTTSAGGIFRAIDHMTAATDFLARDEEGDLEVVGDLIRRTRNPLYEVENRAWNREQQRVMGAVDLSYAPISWLTLQGNLAYDRTDVRDTNRQPAPWKNAYPNPPSQGSMSVRQDLRSEMNASLTASIAREFGDLTTRTRFRYLAEEQTAEFSQAGGSRFGVVGVPRLGLLTTGLNVDSGQESIRSEGLFAVTALTYRQRYITDILVRRDGSSLFGEDERWQTYYRFSGAWRMAEESWWPFQSLTEFRPRYSYGTAGGRPGFDYQYQTYAVSEGRITPRVLGNSELRPELAREHEIGIDALIADRYRIQASYINTTVEDQLLQVPLSSALGFEAQWRNAGTVASEGWELTLETAFVERPDFLWTGRLNVDRMQQQITELHIPPFEMRDYRARVMIREGEELGSFYGYRWARNCAVDMPAGTNCNLFQVNDDGLLVYVGEGNDFRDGVAKGLWGTQGSVDGTNYDWGMPIRSIQDMEELTKLGGAQPSVNLSFLQDFQWRNLGVSLLFDAEFGAQIYNQTMQWGSRESVGAIDQRGKPEELKKPMPYYGAAFLYARNDRNDWYTEDGDYIKLRELSVRYTVDGARLPALIGNAVQRATINFAGRNLVTWTGYLGHDPEVGTGSLGGSASVGRVDEYFYPNFRQFGIDLEIVF